MRYIFMDEITALTADSISGKKYVSLNEDIFRDHFPDQPVLPAALIAGLSFNYRGCSHGSTAITAVR